MRWIQLRDGNYRYSNSTTTRILWKVPDINRGLKQTNIEKVNGRSNLLHSEFSMSYSLGRPYTSNPRVNTVNTYKSLVLITYVRLLDPVFYLVHHIIRTGDLRVKYRTCRWLTQSDPISYWLRGTVDRK